MLRRMLLAASASDRLRGLVVSAPYTRDVVARYVAGDDAGAAVAATRRLQADGLQVSLDYWARTDKPGSGRRRVKRIRRAARSSRRAAWRGMRAAEVSVKPPRSAICPGREKTAAANIARICAAARAAGTTVVDMEDHPTSTRPSDRSRPARQFHDWAV